MKIALYLKTILERLELEGHADSSEWRSLLKETGAKVTQIEDELEEKNKLLALSFDEMTEWSNLINEREALIKSILDSSTDLIFTLNGEGHILETNRNAEEYFSLDMDLIKGRSILELFHKGQFLDELKIFFISHPESEEPLFQGDKLRIKRKIETDKTSFEADVFITLIKTTKKILYVMYIRDLTEELKNIAELDLNRQKSAQSAKMASLGEMAGGIAHEINSPLSVILMNSEIIKDEIENGTHRPRDLITSINQIQSTVNRISKIINGLLKFCRQDDSAKVEIISICEIIEDTAALVRHKLQLQDVQLEISECPPDVLILGNSTGLVQVLINLISNSFDAIQEQREKWIKVDFSESKHTFSLFISDSGNGIPPHIQDKIMQPFFTTKPIGKGTGIGLSISKGIAEQMGGSLNYHPERPNTTFEITVCKANLEDL